MELLKMRKYLLINLIIYLERHYEDSIDNIIYNKETMKLNIKKKEKAVNKLLSKKEEI
jgi:hypothetical protein